MSRFRRRTTERVGRFNVFDVLRHQVEDQQSGALREGFTFDCRDWVSVVPVTEDRRFVLIRQYRHGVDGPTLEVPGGIVDEGQAADEAAVRELREETGYGGGTLIPLGVTHPNPALQGNRYHMFLMRGARLIGEPEFDLGEHCELVVLPEEEARARIRDGSISHALVLLALERAFDAIGDRPISGGAALLDELLSLLAPMEALQASKVIELARRLHPGLTVEDIKNPHDFPDLDDPDWHFADGQLAGIQSALAALRAFRARILSGDKP
ncbi:MAG TPA: NUDIX hydrolase [Polyangiaceae bacterium]